MLIGRIMLDLLECIGVIHNVFWLVGLVDNIYPLIQVVRLLNMLILLPFSYVLNHLRLLILIDCDTSP